MLTRTGTQASQLIFGGIGKGAHLAIKPAETVNLTAGIIAAGSAAQSTDMTGNYALDDLGPLANANVAVGR